MDENKEKMNRLIYSSALTARNHIFENEVPERPNALRLAKWMVNELREIDSIIDQLEKNCGIKSVCKQGCAYCCRQLIVVTSSELIPIECYIRGLSADQKDNMKNRVVNASDAIMNVGLDKEMNAFMSEEEQNLLQKKYFDLGIGCIFLDENKRCGVYQIRPSLCWSYREYDSCENCRASCFSESGVKYDDWEARFLQRLHQARPIKKRLQILPLAVREMMKW